MKSDWDKLLRPNIFKIIRYKVGDLRHKYYIWRDLKKGYIDKDGTPLKCHKCNSKELEEYGQYYEEHYCIEYGVKCKYCGQKLGYWAYGNWEM